MHKSDNIFKSNSGRICRVPLGSIFRGVDELRDLEVQVHSLLKARIYMKSVK